MRRARPAKPHVLTLTDAIGLGGAERIAVELAITADPSRFRRSLCVTRPPAPELREAAAIDRQRLGEADVEVLLLDRHGRSNLSSWKPLVAYLRNSGVNVIHAHKFGSNVWAALLGRALSIPVVIGHEHTWSFEGQRGRRLIDRQVVGRYCDAVIAVSRADRDRMIELVGMPRDRVVLIPNGIREIGTRSPEAIRGELGVPKAVPLLVVTAVLRPQKAIGVMLDAMAVLRRTHPEARLLIVGPGDVDQMRREAQRVGVEASVLFLGPRTDVPDILSAATIGLLSSDFEGSPLAVLEYMAAALPVVCTRVGGVPAIVRDGTTGILVPRRDPAALAQAVGRLLDDPTAARVMGERGRDRQQAEFSESAMAAKVYDLYDRLLATKLQLPRAPDEGAKVRRSRIAADG